jgi:hypothetical protein
MIALPYPTKHCRTEGVGQRLKATIKNPRLHQKSLRLRKNQDENKQRKSPRIKEMEQL